jgi:Mrp family chromosome partitioning ATPase
MILTTSVTVFVRYVGVVENQSRVECSSCKERADFVSIWLAEAEGLTPQRSN